MLRRPAVAVPLALILVLAGLGLAWMLQRNSRVSWARNEALPEIEQAVVSALYAAHAKREPLATAHVRAEIEETRPLSVVMAERIGALREWAAGRTVPCD